MAGANEEQLLRAVALRNASSILKARQRAEEELRQARDELERKTQELAASLAVMKATLDATSDAVLVTDSGSRVTGYNERFRQMWQLPQASLESGDYGRVLLAMAGYFADPGGMQARTLGIARDAPASSFDLLETTDGRAIERSSRPQVVEGHILGRVWSFRDTTEHVRAREALKDESHALELLNRIGRNLAAELEVRDLLQAVIDAGTQIAGAQFGAFFYNVPDDQGGSYQLYTLSGAPREAFEKFGQPRATPLFDPTFRGEAPIRIADVRQDPRFGQWGPHFGMPKGHLPVVSYLAVPVVARSGEVIGGLFFGHPQPGVFTARSERLVVGIAAQAAVAIDNARLYKAAQQAAEQRQQLLDSERYARQMAERMGATKDEFLATLSHELRTPLSAILGWVHILRRGARSPEDLEKGISTIERNCRVQIKLIDDLLDMNRIASGKVTLDLQPVEPIPLLEAAVQTARPAAEAKGVELQLELDPEAPTLAADAPRLQQVIGNLLTNAIKFTPAGGTVRITLARRGSNVEISVADSGLGIAPDFLQHVFERFRQADASTTRQHGGLGLGLAIVKNLAELHGGTVRADSRGLGQGATFVVRLPPLPARQSGLEAKSVEDGPLTRAEPTDVAGVRVLVVDDDADGRELACRILTERSAQVWVADSARAAMELVQRHRPEVLLSDIGMPEVDGFSLLRMVRALGAAGGGSVEAIAFTAFARKEDRERALAGGFTAYVPKPIEASQLLTAVARAAQVHRGNQPQPSASA